MRKSVQRRPTVIFRLIILGAFCGLMPLSAQESDPLKPLVRPTFDRSGQVRGLSLSRDQAHLSLTGEVALGRHDSTGGSPRTVAAVFKGQGALKLGPTSVIERRQMQLHLNRDTLETSFNEAVFLFTDATGSELESALDGEAGTISGEAFVERHSKMAERGLGWMPRVYKSLHSDSPEHHAFFVADLKTKDHGWLTVIFDAADPEQTELLAWRGAFPTLVNKFSHQGLSPGQAFADPLSSREYLTPDYRIDLQVDKGGRLTATVELSLDLRRDGERVLLFDLTPDLRVESVRMGDEAVRFFQPPKDRPERFAASYLGVIAPKPLAKGAYKLRFQYSGKGVVSKVGNGSYFCRSFGWYPTVSSGRFSPAASVFAERSHFEITLSVPKRNQGVSVGEELSRRREGDWEITQWRSEIPLAVAGFSFGRYAVKTEKVGDAEVRIYANEEADDSMKAIEQRADPGLQRNGTLTNGVALGSLSPRRLRTVMAQEVGNNLRVMETYFGKYPYTKLAVVNIPFSYGQGWPSLLYLSSLTFLDSTQRHTLGITDSVRITDFFRAHETSHQWWGHVVGWKSYHDQWLSEGFAQFSGNLYTWFRKSPQEYFERLKKDREVILLQSSGRALNDVGPIHLGRRLASRRHPRAYSALVYNKGGWVLHMLRMMMYDFDDQPNADKRFIKMMKDFTATHFNQAASTEDFKRTVEKHMLPWMNVDGNGRMDWFFDAWVYGTDVPKYKLDFHVEPAKKDGHFTVSGILHQTEVPEGFRMTVPLYLHQGDGSMRVGFITALGERTPFNLPDLPFKPDRVSINEWSEVLTR